MSIARRHYLYTGRVQGVGFRYTVKNIALRYNITGYVRNLPDGRVEMCLQGSPTEIDQMASEVAQKMNSFIKQTHTEDHPPATDLQDFSIRR